MVAREFKNSLHFEMRETDERTEENYSKIAVNHFNSLFIKSNGSEKFWKKILDGINSK
jgi:hypothetical protein